MQLISDLKVPSHVLDCAEKGLYKCPCLGGKGTSQVWAGTGRCRETKMLLHGPDRLGRFALSLNSFTADFLAPSAGKNIYVREIKLQSLTFVNTAITVANGTEGVLSTIVANGSERVKFGRTLYIIVVVIIFILLLLNY